jgi:hypothetical protein
LAGAFFSALSVATAMSGKLGKKVVRFGAFTR